MSSVIDYNVYKAAIMRLLSIFLIASGLYSQVSWAGNCDCPYDLDARGNLCGARAAYSLQAAMDERGEDQISAFMTLALHIIQQAKPCTKE